ncbi:inner membrane protein YpjD [Castellaniella sp.]|uniref:cytochrome C assembly family protein n=1 Tax=Castellaniella sp. TaxID=1955812 RepID=UPI0035625386
MSVSIVFHLLAALAYALLGLAVWRPLLRPSIRPAAEPDLASWAASAPISPRLGRVCLLGAIILHGAGLGTAILVPQGLYLGWALALSVAFWLGMIVFWIENFLLRLDSLQLLLLPAAALACILAALFPEGYLVPHASSDWLRLHLLISMVAYGLMTVSALHALLMATLDRHLHRPILTQDDAGPMHKAMGLLPPLLTLEQLLFRLIGIGFIVLTLSILTGIIVSLQFSDLILPLDHKSVFTLLSWLTFGVLLTGRRLRGWRGRTALRWTLAGFVFLLLSYTGSRFVLEVILQRAPLG